MGMNESINYFRPSRDYKTIALIANFSVTVSSNDVLHIRI